MRRNKNKRNLFYIMEVDILIFSAHPDDCEFGMGGTLLKLAKQYSVANIVLTKGQAGTYGTPDEREKEVYEAGKFAGYHVEVLDYEDNNIEYSVKIAKEMASIIRKYKPKLIFVPYHTNNYQHTDGTAHPDHTELGKIIKAAARFAKFKNAKLEGCEHCAKKIIYYMIPKYHKPTFVVDVSDVIEELVPFWKCHKSQTQLRNGEIIEYLTDNRKFTGQWNGLVYAEAFIVEEPLKLDINKIDGI
jgi:N-acetylglucosamine malate deacetylase 1